PGLNAETISRKSPNWVDRPMRWAQLTLVENDPGKFDPKFWLEYFRRTQTVRVRLPADANPRRVRLLASGKAPRLEHRGSSTEYLTVTVPSILDHEMVAIDF